jgi:sugar-specific transcriptional regulator TrmB
MLEDLLKNIGLSNKEAKMYLTCLKHGSQPTSSLGRQAGFNRGTAYAILHALFQKGLVSKVTKQKVQYFSAVEPTQLLEYVDHQTDDLKRNRSNLEAALSQFEAIIHPLSSKPTFEFFDGAEGARLALEQTLQSTDKTLRSFMSITDMVEFIGYEQFDNYTNRRIEAGYKLEVLRTKEHDKEAFQNHPQTYHWVTSDQENRELNYVDEDLAFPMTMYLFDEKVLVISSKEENFALLITSKEYSNMQKKLFDLLWKTSKS